MFRIGQKVVCVEDKGQRGRPPFAVKGNIYTISDMVTLPDYCIGAVRLEELAHAMTEPHEWLFAWRFRPVKETDISIFTAMLAPKPKEKAE